MTASRAASDSALRAILWAASTSVSSMPSSSCEKVSSDLRSKKNRVIDVNGAFTAAFPKCSTANGPRGSQAADHAEVDAVGLGNRCQSLTFRTALERFLTLIV